MQFLELFKDSIFVSIPKAGGFILHTHLLQKVLDRNNDSLKEGAYFTVNGFANFKEGDYHGRKKENVTSFNASFLDIDLTPETRRMQAELMYKSLCDTGLTPTALVLTGKGMHIYWVYKDPAQFSESRLAEYEMLQNAIVSHFEKEGADRQARDAARVLRIPGGKYYDGKGEHTGDIELLKFHPEILYEPKTLAEYFKNSMPTMDGKGTDLVQLTGDSEFDISKYFGVKRGTMHHDSFSLSLSLLQSSKDISSALKLYKAITATWQQPLDWQKCLVQFDNARKFLEKDKPQLFISTPVPSMGLVPFDEVPGERLEWLWDGVIPKGKGIILQGMPGFGKSQVTIDIAARLSTGRPFPSITLGAVGKEPLGVIILSAEDGAKDTIKPRLLAAGADMKRVYHMPSARLTRDKAGRLGMNSVALKEDAEAILDAIAHLPYKIGLIIVDPASAFMSKDADANSNSDVRNMFAQLQAVIMDKGISMLMINHLNKNTGAKSAHMRGLGATAWNGVARSTLYAFQDGEDRFVLSLDKNNLAKKTGKGFFYKIQDQPVDLMKDGMMEPSSKIEWNLEEFPTKTADEYAVGESKHSDRKDECMEELEMFLAGAGAVAEVEVMRHMKRRGFTAIRVYGAGRKIGVIGENQIWQKI